ncbi:MAG: septum formation initiator family protein [Armatimonadetes bacterium]|nr:septum formation initiator family protein [Armatimonadota bacterium]
MVAVGVLVVVGAVFGSVYWEGYQVRREAARLVRERDELRLQNAQLREEIGLLDTPEYVERLAREQLGLVRPGEIAVILVRPTPAPAPEPSSKPAGDAPGWWTRLRWLLR